MYVTDLIQKVIDESFFVETSKGIKRIVSGNWFYHEDKYFYVEDVLKKILELVEINNSYFIDLGELHDIMFAGYIDNKEVLEAIQNHKP